MAEAYAVQVVLGEKAQVLRDPTIEVLTTPKLENPYSVWVDLMHLAAVIVNRGAYTITRVEAQLSPDGRSLLAYRGQIRVSSFAAPVGQAKEGFEAAPEAAMHASLTPWNAGLRFEVDAIDRKHPKNPYPVVRWTDRWGTRWENKRGEVRQVDASEAWTP